MKQFVKKFYSALGQTEKILALVALLVGVTKFIAEGLKAIYPDIDKPEQEPQQEHEANP